MIAKTLFAVSVTTRYFANGVPRKTDDKLVA
jgi:hypothetical protein